MAQRDVLDVGGIDIVAAADDHVLGAARDVDLAVLADAPEVAAAQPAFMESRADLLRVEITGEHLRSTRENFSARRGAAMNLAVGEHGDFRERDGTSDRAWRCSRSHGVCVIAPANSVIP